MSLLSRFLGSAFDTRPPEPEEPESMRRIQERLEGLDPETARFLSAFAYVLARAANADLNIDEAEVAAMERSVEALASLPPSQARMIVEIARRQTRKLGATDNYLVTREFRRIATAEQCHKLVRCLFAVAASDDHISSEESIEVLAIAEELGIRRPQALGIRAHWKDKLAEFKRLPGER
jgi:uncharacterized tellurite resistance protein B-like protein